MSNSLSAYSYGRQLSAYSYGAYNLRPQALNGFFGDLWGKVKEAVGNNLAATVGGLIGGAIGGPLGAAVGAAVAEFVMDWGQENGLFGALGNDLVAEEYPITLMEEQILVNWFKDYFAPTLSALANKIDSVISLDYSAGGLGLTKTSSTNLSQIVLGDSVLQAANDVLKAIAVFRAHNAFVIQNGEYLPLMSTAPASINFTKNKVDFIEYYLNALEKSVLDFIQKERPGKYSLVASKFTASETKMIEMVKFNWQNRTVEAAITQFKVNVVVDEVEEPGTGTGTGTGTNVTPPASGTVVLDPQTGTVTTEPGETVLEIINTDPTDQGTAATDLPDPTLTTASSIQGKGFVNMLKYGLLGYGLFKGIQKITS